MIQFEKPLVITEGKTDWKHLKAALRRLKLAGRFSQLDIEFWEYGDDTQMGDTELLKLCKSYHKLPNSRKIFFIFDRDNPSIMRQVSDDEIGYVDWGNNAFSFVIPLPAHRQQQPEVCIEFYYLDEELRRKDSFGRRLFLSNEFHPHSGLDSSGSIHCMALGKIRRPVVTIIDDEVFDRTGQNIALSKDEFANHVLSQTPPFDDLNVDEFANVFEIIATVVQEPVQDRESVETKPGSSILFEFSPEPIIPRGPDRGPWRLPKPDRVFRSTREDQDTITDREREELRGNLFRIESTFLEFDIPVRVTSVSTGPIYTQYLLQLSVSRNRAFDTGVLANEEGLVELGAALELELRSPVEIQIKLDERHNALEVLAQNRHRHLVRLGDVLRSAAPSVRHRLGVCLGKHVDDASACFDLSELAHLLITGQVASGKSTCLDSILTCLLLQNTPEELRLAFADATGVEFTRYASLPHLMHSPVTDAREFESMIKYLVDQAEIRSSRMSAAGMRNLNDFNSILHGTGETHLPILIIGISEISDFLHQAGGFLSKNIINRVTHLFPSVGIYLLATTRQPANSVLPERIVSCFGGRIALRSASREDSLAFLGAEGAEKLFGQGDLLLKYPKVQRPIRIHGGLVSEEQIADLVAFWKNQNQREPVVIPVERPSQ
jgi:DNA segregation ATPase FtsK/SpoIIIE-like protein